MAELRPGKFGRKEAVIKCIAKEGKNGGSFGLGTLQIGNKVYRVTITNGQKEDKRGNQIMYWCNVSEYDNNRRQMRRY